MGQCPVNNTRWSALRSYSLKPNGQNELHWLYLYFYAFMYIYIYNKIIIIIKVTPQFESKEVEGRGHRKDWKVDRMGKMI